MALEIVNLEALRVERMREVTAEMEHLGAAANRGRRAMLEFSWCSAIAFAGEYIVMARRRWWHLHRVAVSRSMSFGMADEAMWQARQAGLRGVKLVQVSSPWR